MKRQRQDSIKKDKHMKMWMECLGQKAIGNKMEEMG